MNVKKIFLDTELSVRYGTSYAIEQPIINKNWLSYVIYFDVAIVLIAEMNKLPAKLIAIEEYPLEEIAKLKVTDQPITDSFEIKIRSILFCMKNNIIFCPTEADTINERRFLINKAGEHLPGAIKLLKKSFLTIDVINLIIFDNIPIDGEFSENLSKSITDYKSSEHISILRDGIERIVISSCDNYYLSEDLRSNILSNLVSSQSQILDLLDFDKITSFDIKSLVADGISSIGGLLTPIFPLSTIQEIYVYFRNNKKIKNNSDILFTLSVMYLQKIIIKNSIYTQKKQCHICKLTSIEIDHLDDKDVSHIIFKSTGCWCVKHIYRYLEVRKSNGLMGRSLLKAIIE